MQKDVVLATLKSAESELRAKGVLHAALFGSVARGEQRSDSDIDIMVEIDPRAGVGVWEYVGITNVIKDLFSAEVDVSNRRAMRDHVRPGAERDAIYAF